jgi:hypothetical protein
MTSRPAPDRARPASPLSELLAALRAVMADERRAVARLDLESIESIGARKHALAVELARLQATGCRPDPEDARAIAATRLELAASSSLLGTAVAAVAAVLGLEPDDRYDRLARTHVQTRPLRVVAY